MKRRIGGRDYYLSSVSKKKTNADKIAKDIRKEGMRARVIELQRNKKSEYGVYFNPAKR